MGAFRSPTTASWIPQERRRALHVRARRVEGGDELGEIRRNANCVRLPVFIIFNHCTHSAKSHQNNVTHSTVMYYFIHWNSLIPKHSNIVVSLFIITFLKLPVNSDKLWATLWLPPTDLAVGGQTRTTIHTCRPNAVWQLLHMNRPPLMCGIPLFISSNRLSSVLSATSNRGSVQVQTELWGGGQ